MRKVHFAGPSGIGKTTLAKEVEYTQGLKFISGSMSSLIPTTKDQTHVQMLSESPNEKYLRDYQLANLRGKVFAEAGDDMVTDRSFLDLAAYFWYNQASALPACEIEHFLELTKMLCNKHCTHLIFLSLDTYQIGSWFIEDNNKRILSGYFQSLISSIMGLVLEYWGAEFVKEYHHITKGVFKNEILDYGAVEYIIESPYGYTKVLQVRELNKHFRQHLINSFIK